MPSSSRNEPPEITFFSDRDLGSAIPDRLREAGVSVVAHDEVFPQTTTDVEWLRGVAGRGWVVLTRNRKIRGTPRETRAVMESGVACFFLIGPQRTHSELAENLIQTLPKIYKFLGNHSPPFLAKIYKPPKVEMWTLLSKTRILILVGR